VAAQPDTAQRADLKRVFLKNLDLLQPPTVAEEEYLNMVIVHYVTGWQMAKVKSVLTPDALAADARAFFSLPLPRAVWEKTKDFRDKRFVRFVERAMKA
jgi:hypothetical protein